MKTAKEYADGVGMVYETPKVVSEWILPVLPFLSGHPWNDVALEFVHTVRPSHVRVIAEEELVKTTYEDYRETVPLWGVTVLINEFNIIVLISQCCEVPGQHSKLFNRATKMGISVQPK